MNKTFDKKLMSLSDFLKSINDASTPHTEGNYKNKDAKGSDRNPKDIIMEMTSVKHACDMANNFLEKGFSVFIEGTAGRKMLEQYSSFFKDKNFKAFLLLPSVDSLLKRFDDRGVNEELRQRTVDLHKQFSEKKDELNCQIINSSNQTLEETVQEIYKAIL